MRRAVFLDRDGTINRMVYDQDHGLVDSPATADGFVLLDGAADAIRRINTLGLLAVVVSNQPGIAKGRFTQEHLDEVTARMTEELSRQGAYLDWVYYCLHHPEAVRAEWRAACDCRKPRPGLLLRGCEDFGIDLRLSYMVGDGLTDVLAGRSVGCTTIWIGRSGLDTHRVLQEAGAIPEFVATSLSAAVDIIVARETSYADLPRYSESR